MANLSSLLHTPSGVSAVSQIEIQPREWCLQCRAFGICQPQGRRQGPLRISATPPRWGYSTIQRGRVVGIRCKSASGGETPPESKEEAIEQAAGSVSSLLEKALKRRGPTTVKQRRQERQVKLRVEIPVLDDAPSSLVSLTLDLVSALFPSAREPLNVAVFFPDASFVTLARDLSSASSFHSLQSEQEVPSDVAVIVIAGARFDDTASLQALARNVTPRPVVVLNPEWSPDDESDASWGAFVSSFDAAYAFLPLAIQGLFSKTEGAVVKSGRSGAPWLIFVKEADGTFTRLSSLKRRPGPAELESALYNAMAANSPVTKSIKFLRGLVSND